jgi:hypothetical protein
MQREINGSLKRENDGWMVSFLPTIYAMRGVQLVIHPRQDDLYMNTSTSDSAKRNQPQKTFILFTISIMIDINKTYRYYYGNCMLYFSQIDHCVLNMLAWLAWLMDSTYLSFFFFIPHCLQLLNNKYMDAFINLEFIHHDQINWISIQAGLFMLSLLDDGWGEHVLVKK